jgi:hypothetical protein
MSERNRVMRAPEDILIAILTQTESQLNGLSTVQITIDHKSPDLQNIALESTRNLFIQQSADTYKASQINISIFINILIGVKANGWTLMGTNAFLNNTKQEVVKTFYFEKIGAGKTLGKTSNGTSSSSPIIRLTPALPVPPENGNRYSMGTNGFPPPRVQTEMSPKDSLKISPREVPASNRRQATEEQKDSRVNGSLGGTPNRRSIPSEPDAYVQASQREVIHQREREAAAIQRESVNLKERESASQRERELALQRERELANLKEREIANQRERDIAAQRERDAALQRERETAQQRERDVAIQRDRDAAREKELLASQRDAAVLRERDAANLKEREMAHQREINQRAIQVVDYSQRSGTPPPIETKSPNNSGPGAIDFNKFPARLRPSPSAKGDKASSIQPSDIQKKNAEYFKRMKKVIITIVYYVGSC